jgi:hypothetical protein
MKIIGCDLHARQQTIAMLDTDTGEFVEKTLEHDGEELRKFYSGLSLFSTVIRKSAPSSDFERVTSESCVMTHAEAATATSLHR